MQQNKGGRKTKNIGERENVSAFGEGFFGGGALTPLEAALHPRVSTVQRL